MAYLRTNFSIQNTVTTQGPGYQRPAVQQHPRIQLAPSEVACPCRSPCYYVLYGHTTRLPRKSLSRVAIEIHFVYTAGRVIRYSKATTTAQRRDGAALHRMPCHSLPVAAVAGRTHLLQRIVDSCRNQNAVC